MLAVSCRTHPGAVRDSNQDGVLWDPALSFIAVADGMGGHNAGDVASRLALDTVRVFLAKSAADDQCTWPFGIKPSQSLAMNRITTAVQLANRRVFRESELRVEYTGMGTTVVGALIEGAHVTYVNVGDSRLYLADRQRLQQVTRDDTWADLLSRGAGVDVGSVAQHSMRHILTNVVGARPDVQPAAGELDLQDGETVLLCSDGLHTALPDAALHAILAAESDMDRCADALIRAALEAKCEDNVSVVLARYVAD